MSDNGMRRELTSTVSINLPEGVFVRITGTIASYMVKPDGTRRYTPEDITAHYEARQELEFSATMTALRGPIVSVSLMDEHTCVAMARPDETTHDWEVYRVAPDGRALRHGLKGSVPRRSPVTDILSTLLDVAGYSQRWLDLL